jgi:serine/threonine-protein kinase
MDLAHPGPADKPAADALPALPEGLEIIRLLGVGKMARVYLARERELERVVAIKVLRPELATDETARLRFEREARSAASLTHPNIVAVYRFGRLANGTPYLVMSYVQGRTLADRLQAEGTMGESQARALIAQLASALAAAHKKGIVHRDVRPANVLIEDETGRILLSDFGIAALLEGGGESAPRLTRTGQMMGEPRYSSPEQLRGEKVTGQADIYSLGVLAYEVLTGEGPYKVSSTREIFAAHLTGQPRPISQVRPMLSRDLEDLLLRCLAREPAHRPRAEDVVKRLETSAPAGGAAGQPQADEGLGILRRRMPQIVASTFAGGLVLVGLMSDLTQNDVLPDVLFPLAVNLAVWALLAAGVLGWFHGAKGTQQSTATEKMILAAIAVGWVATTVLLVLR